LVNGGKRGLLSIGAFLIVIVISILLIPLNILNDWTLILPSALALFGCWTIILAGIRASSPQKYERGVFSTLSWGLLLLAIGGAWFLYAYGFAWFYSLIAILLALALLAIAATFKQK
jgi:uncharacterized membrane protein